MTVYRATQAFNRVEAVDSGRIDPADPSWLHVRVTPAGDLSNELEAFLMPSQNPHGIPPTTSRPYRLFTGTWSVDLTPGLYEDGKQYTISWRYAMTPNNFNVVHDTFVWQPIPIAGRDGGTILYGTVLKNKNPVAGARVTVEQYSNYITLTERTLQVDVSTDAFGHWWLEVPHKSNARVIYPESIKTVAIADQDTLDLADATEWQIDDVVKDSFGYPVPTTGGKGKGVPSEMLGIADCGLPPGNIDDLPPEDPTDTKPTNPLSGCCRYEHTQSAPSTVWTVTHNLDGHPSVTVVDASGDTVIGDVSYTSLNVLTITFLAPISGYAYLD